MRRDLGLGLLLTALTLAVYWPVRTHDFIAYDDPQFVTENAQIQSGLSWPTLVYAFTTPVAGNWHPITTLSHALDCELFGLNPGAHHLVNALLHALNAGLLFLALQQLTSSLAASQPDPKRKTQNQPVGIESLHDGSAFAGRNFVIAALFAFHPLRVESVAWLAERKDLLAGFFFLLTLWAYARYAQARGVAAHLGAFRIAGSRRAVARAQRVVGFLSAFGLLPRCRASAAARVSDLKNGFVLQAQWERARAWVFYLGCLLCFALGLLSKPMVVTLPFVLLLLDLWPLQRMRSADQGRGTGHYLLALLFEKVPFLLLSAAACWVTLRVQAGAGAMEVIQNIGWPERLGNAITSYARYLGKLFWPTDLAAIYPHPAKHYYLSDAWPGWEISFATLLLLLISIVCVRLLRPFRDGEADSNGPQRGPTPSAAQQTEAAHHAAYPFNRLRAGPGFTARCPYLAVGWFWFLGTLVPVIGLVQVGEQAMADRYTYIPLIGPVIALVWAGGELIQAGGIVRALSLSRATGERRRFGRIIAAGAIVGLLGVLVLLTRRQLDYWQNTVTLFAHTIAVTPDNPSAQFALGVGLEAQGQPSRAMVRYRVAVAIDPHYGKAYYNMGQILRKAGRWQKAAEAYLAAARCNPRDVATQLNLASVLPHLGKANEAIDHFNRALELDPSSLEGLNNLAWLLSTAPNPQLRDGARAVQLAERACFLTGYKVPVFLGTLAAAYAEMGRFPEAVVTAQNAAALAAQVGDSATASKNQELAELYGRHKAYRDPQDQP